MIALLVLAFALPQDEKLDDRVAAVLPKRNEERWLAIPWESNLTKAGAESQRKGKPIFLWVMDGNVLGCT